MLKNTIASLITMGRPFTHIDALEKFCFEVFEDLSPNSSIRVLDIGAGGAQYWTELGENPQFPSTRLTLMDAATTVGPEQVGSIRISRLRGFAPVDLNQFEDNSFDLVIAFDLIEHLSRSDGYQLVYEMERISKNAIGIFTPNGFVYQPPAPNNPFNAHIAGWVPKDFEDLLFQHQFGHVGFKRFFGPYAARKASSFVPGILLTLMDLVAANFPKKCFSLSYWKRVQTSPPPNQSL